MYNTHTAEGLAWIYETRVNNVLTTPAQLCKLAVLTAPYLEAKLIIADRSPICQPCEH